MTGTASAAGPTPAGTTPAGSAPAGQLTGLCRAWQAKKPQQREQALRTPAFAQLVTAAGGVSQVGAYCQRLVPGPTPTPSSTLSPTPTRSAKVKPSHSAKGRPTGD
ncbi:hypothetical protein F8271_31090 [Micromonospora sp. ALFpr18c]|nr:hypothetical protein F8271_31090 [Micromonospora sp. ALFpr18c]